MANELVHGDTGAGLDKAEYENVGAHIFNNQATGDMLYASSATQLSRLAIGTDGYSLMVVGGVPVWVNHNALNTGVHGAGGSTLATAATLATHAGLTATHGAADIADKSDIAVDANLSAAAQAAVSASHSVNDVGTHGTATTGVHGVGAGTVAKVSDIAATKIDDLTAGDDNTDLNASTTKHGLQAKFPNTAAERFQKEDGTWAVPAGGGTAYAAMPVILAAIQNGYVSGSLDKVQLSQLTHLAYDRAIPTSGADATLIITDTNNLTHVVTDTHAAGKLAGVVLKDNSCLSTIADDPDLLDDYAANVAAMVAAYDLDFLLLDWEGGGDTQARVEVLLHHLDDACPSIPIMAAVGWYTYQMTTTTVADHVEYLWLMTYDMGMPNGNPFHANYQDTIEVMKYWEDGGYPAAKLLLGIPFYSKDSNGSLCKYAVIVGDFNPAPDLDYVLASQVSVGFSSTPETVTGGVAWFGGVNHNKRLVDYCRLKGYGGVGIWDVAQDLLDNHPSSLLRAIYEKSTAELNTVIEDTVYEYVTVNDVTKNSDNFTGAGGKLVAQTFTPATSHTVNKVSLSLYRNAGAGTVTVTIRTTSGGLPTATVLATGTVLIDNHPAAYRRVDFDLGAGAALTAGTKYAVVMGVSGTGDIYYQLDTAGTYSGGNQCYYDGSWHTGTSGWDVWFREGELNPASPVEESGLILPTPSRKYENKRFTVLGAVGTHDHVYTCLKSTANVYTWILLTDGGA